MKLMKKQESHETCGNHEEAPKILKIINDETHEKTMENMENHANYQKSWKMKIKKKS